LRLNSGPRRELLLLVLAHVGYTTGAVGISQKFALRRPLDYRLVVLMTILPDVIDRALYVFVIPGAQSGRLFAHTLIFNLLLLAVLVAIRRDLWVYGVLPLVHLLLDLQSLSAGQLFWPLSGADLSNVGIPSGLGEAAGQGYVDRVGDRIADILGTYGGASLWSFLIDAGGFAALTILAVKARLYQWPRLRRLIAVGSI
jgi:hypothetical protein